MTYIVIETQTDKSGTVAIVPPTSYTDRNEAESKYHTILSAAAVSSVYIHAAVMLTCDGRRVMGEAYVHGEDEDVQD